MSNQVSLLTNGGEVASVQNMGSEDRARYTRNLIDTMAGETFRAYRSRLAAFSAWCAEVGRSSIPAEPATVAAYLEELERQGKKPATVCQVVAAIAKAHKAEGLASPCSSDIVKAARKAAIRRAADRGEGAPHQKDAATLGVLRTIISGIDGTALKDKRDKALLLMGFFGAFRRSELSALRCSDLREDRAADGRPVLVVTVRKSKTDQAGHGMEKAIFAAAGRSKAACPVRAVRDWIAAAGLAGALQYFKNGKPDNYRVVIAITGHGLKR